MYSIGYDIGSSSIKISIIENITGKAVATRQEPAQEMEIKAVQPGWAEQDPELWWEYVCQGTKTILAENGIPSDQVKHIGISYQMHGLVLIDKDGKLIRDAIIWCDSRAVEIGHNAFSEIGQKKCAEHLLNSPGNFTASKLRWVRQNEPENYKRVYKFMLPGDYIAFRLSEKICTTPSGLSEGILWDFKEKNVSNLVLEHYGISKELVPEILPTLADQGIVSNNAAQESGLDPGTTIRYRAGDQPNNALTLNVMQPGEVAATGGTSGVMYAIGDTLSANEFERINSFVHVNNTNEQPRIGKLLNINGCGILYRWLKENLDVPDYETMNDLAVSVPVGSEGVIILPFGNGAERMLHNTTTGMQILNVNYNIHTKAHLCRAALEGIAFAFIYGSEIIKNEGIPITSIRTGNDNLFRAEIFSQTVATLLEHKIEMYSTTGAVGAARAALFTTQPSGLDMNTVLQADFLKEIEPMKEVAPYRNAYQNWRTTLEQTLRNQTQQKQ